MEKSKKNSLALNIIMAIVSVAAVASIATIFTNRNSEWFNALIKPTFYPPVAVFPIVWALIYLSFMFIIFWLLNKNQMTIPILILLILNGVFNILWCLVFFTLHSIIAGVVVIILNLGVAVLLSVYLFKQNRLLGWISLFYVLWLAFATLLNIIILFLNI